MAEANKKTHQPEQLPTRPGRQHRMAEQPKTHKASHRGSGKLEGQVVLITGGDSGIGRAVAVACAVEGAKVVISYLEEAEDAAVTQRMVRDAGSECLAVAGDIGQQAFCVLLVQKTIDTYGRLDVLVNNAAEQHPQDDIAGISAGQLERTFRTNIFSMFYLTQAAVPHMEKGSSIINTTSVTAYAGNPQLLDYSATKGAIVAFTRSLSLLLAEKGIRVNAVAPGPIWTPLIPSTFPPEKVETFGQHVPMGRSGEPEEVASAFIFLASDDASYISGQTIHVNGGTIVNG
jgi:NAD(P)-dependent dehydrogenase (short-subunit alcohol dehydrogenase family)